MLILLSILNNLKFVIIYKLRLDYMITAANLFYVILIFK